METRLNSNAQSGLFWSGETLAERLPELVEPFSEERIDCAAYTLSIGPEVYVSPTDETAEPNSVTVRSLAPNEAFTIPPGQFAFLLTEEVVSVPSNALAFISIRAKSKFRGLLNVSGFHVDPGFRGQLTFAVFNAGPVTIHLRRGQPIFLIWYAGLDRPTEYKKFGGVRTGIDVELIASISGELLSFAGLSKKIKGLEKELTDRVHSIEKEQTYSRVIASIVLSLIIGFALTWAKDRFTPKPSSPASSPPSATTPKALESEPHLPLTAPTPRPDPSGR